MSKKATTITSLFLFCGALGFLLASLSTNHWLEAKIFNSQESNVSDPTAYKGFVNFGLFQGFKSFKPLNTPYNHFLTIVCNWEKGLCMFSAKSTGEARENELMENINPVKGKPNMTDSPDDEQLEGLTNSELISFSLWAVTVAFVVGSILMGIIGVIFSVVNTVMTPVEFVTGIQGLHLWNIFGGLFSILSMIIWEILYSKSLSRNVLTKEDINSNWSSENTASHGYSFWLLIGSIILYATNSVAVTLLTLQPWVKKQTKLDEASNPEGIIMLY